MNHAPKRDDVEVIHKTMLHEGRLKLVDLKYDAPTFAGGVMEGVSREVVMREDCAAALVHDIERDVIILCEQFRAPAYLAGGVWLTELPAGKLDGDESPEQCMRRELEEEIGYRARSLDPIGVYFASAGYSTERVHLFYVAVTAEDLVDVDAGGVDAGENIRRVEQPLKTFLDRLKRGKFEDGKILAAGAWAVSTLASA